ncbi:hypothetical protein GGR54DRAFT_40707 [Hypoxylon sp. NC1633]|nr:hypothetical protein GGR54DRAFT_40707 [Hypoxylon sp. NC1633]
MVSDQDIVDSSQAISTEVEPLGSWEQAAALQSRTHNLSHHRRFITLWHRLQLHEQSKIADMEEILAQLDKEAGEEPELQIRKAALDKGRLMLSSHYDSTSRLEEQGDNRGDPIVSSDSNMKQTDDVNEGNVKDRLIEMTLDRLKRYAESLLLMHKLQQLPRTSRREWSSLYNTLKAHNVLEGNGWDFLSEPSQDDFLSTKTERVDRRLAPLVYGDALLSRAFRRMFQSTGHQDAKDQDQNKRTIYLHTNGIESFIKALVAIAIGIILMVPIGILLLQPMNKAGSLVVVLCFGAAFIVVLTLLNTELDAMLLAVFAYAAVLVTFLANIQDSKGCAC